MRRIIVTTSLLFCTLLSLFSSSVSFSELVKGENWIPDSTVLKAGNDMWTFGFSINNDDQLSYAVGAAVSAPAWHFNFELGGITNRGWKNSFYKYLQGAVSDGNDGNDSFIQGRYDLLSFKLGLDLSLLENSLGSITFTPELGVFYAGNVNFQYAQNFIHDNSQIPPLVLSYEKGSYFNAILNGELSGYLNIHQFTNSLFRYGFVTRFENYIAFQSNQFIGSKLDLLTRSGHSFFSVELGYTQSEAFASWDTLKLYSAFLTGLTYGFTLDTGLLKIVYEASPVTGYGFTRYGVDLFGFDGRSSWWRRSDIYYSFGIFRSIGHNFHDLELGWNINDNWAMILKNRYVAGNAVYLHNDEALADNNYRVKLNYGSYSIGAKGQYSFASTASWLGVYGEVALGLMNWDIRVLTNMDPNATSPWTVQNNTISFLLDVEAGFNLIPEGFFKSSGTTYTLSLFGGFGWINNPEAIQVVDYDQDVNAAVLRMHGFLPRLGFRMNLGFDL